MTLNAFQGHAHNYTRFFVAIDKISTDTTRRVVSLYCNYVFVGWLGSRVVSVLDSSAKGPGFKAQPRRCRVTVLMSYAWSPPFRCRFAVAVIAVAVAKIPFLRKKIRGKIPSRNSRNGKKSAVAVRPCNIYIYLYSPDGSTQLITENIQPNTHIHLSLIHI